VLLERGAALLAEEAALRRELQQLAGLEAGELVVGAGPFSAAISVGRAMARFLAEHPQIRARVVRSDSEQVVRDVLAGRCDLAVADPGTPGRGSELRREPLPSHPIHLFARPDHPLADRAALRLADVLAFPIVGARIRGAAAARLHEQGPAGRIDPDTGDFLPAITVDSLDLARRIAAATPAILPAVRGLVAEDLRDGNLVPLDFHEPWMRTTYALLLRRDLTLSPAASAFVETLLAVEAEIAADSADLRGNGPVLAPDVRSH
jgi:DNA-binding transcriptional LysR family regulator